MNLTEDQTVQIYAAALQGVIIAMGNDQLEGNPMGVVKKAQQLAHGAIEELRAKGL